MFNIVVTLAALTLAASAPQPIVVQQSEVTYRHGEVTIAATLNLPRSSGKLPAVVIVHGSGTSDRTNAWTTAYADALARSGIVVLYPDKRGSGKSTGDWRTASFADLAGDVAAGVQLLQTRREVDPHRIGVIGFSQGGYVVSILAAEDSTVAFTAVVSGGVARLSTQMVDELSLDAAAANAPLTTTEDSTLRALYTRAFEFAQTGQGFAELRRGVASAQTSPSLSKAAESLPPDSSHWAFKWIRRTGDFDPLPYWRRARRPVAFLYGGRDEHVRTRASVERLWDAVGTNAPNFVVLMLQGNRHALFREDAVAFLARWINDGGVP